MEEVDLCLMIAGLFDYLLAMRTRDMAHFRQVLDETFNKLPGILQTNSLTVMDVATGAAFNRNCALPPAMLGQHGREIRSWPAPPRQNRAITSASSRSAARGNLRRALWITK